MWLFRLALSLAFLLIAVVLIAPWLDNEEQAPEGWRRALHLFAQDATLRRTSLASAVGIIVTACVFFRPPRTPSLPAPEVIEPEPPPSDVVGA